MILSGTGHRKWGGGYGKNPEAKESRMTIAEYLAIVLAMTAIVCLVCRHGYARNIEVCRGLDALAASSFGAAMFLVMFQHLLTNPVFP